MMPTGGSSPHARGARLSPRDHVGEEGIIPACAGSTRSGAASPRSRRDHPRMRGEHVSHGAHGPLPRGSSPHARGALRADAMEAWRWGIIPACAGSTPLPIHHHLMEEDHPRMRGEHLVWRCCSASMAGSSPHARGAPTRQIESQLSGGIIPACAGSTRARSRRPSPSRDHPRMRGEHTSASRSAFVAQGSSPHARGAPGRHARCLHAGRIIPACAGSTTDCRNCLHFTEDHPRMRGEHPLRRGGGVRHWGSSPHARGAPRGAQVRQLRERIIPACAGSTIVSKSVTPTDQDHPRMRGEHDRPVQMKETREGSSPHARGALRRP